MTTTTESSTLAQGRTEPSARPMESPRSAVTTVIALVGLGAVAGAIGTFLVLGVGAIFAQLGNPESVRLSQLVVSVFSRMTNVLTVWIQAPVDGAITGAATGAAVSIAYLIALWIDRSWAIITGRRWLFAIALAAAGAISAGLVSRGVLADVRLWAAAAGALYGLAAAYSISQSRGE